MVDIFRGVRRKIRAIESKLPLPDPNRVVDAENLDPKTATKISLYFGLTDRYEVRQCTSGDTSNSNSSSYAIQVRRLA